MTIEDDQDRLREAWLDLMYTVVTTLGLVRLIRRFGMTPKPWITKREEPT